MLAVGQPRDYVPAWERRVPLAPVKPAQSAKGGGKSPYRLGKDFEDAIRGYLGRRQYFTMRAGASKGKIDVLAVGPATAAKGVSGLFIQAKRTGVIGSAEWNQVYDIAIAAGGWPIVCMRESPRTISFYRLDERRVPRRKGRPWTLIDARDCRELHPPLQLI